MKNLKTYLPSLVISVLLVFALLGTSAIIVVKAMANEKSLIKLTEEKNVSSMVNSELSGYFSKKYNETGIPAEIYTDALTDDYIRESIKIYISGAFDALENDGKLNVSLPENKKLEENLSTFFIDYADSIDHEKDDAFYEKVNATIESAYRKIADACDIYKMKTAGSEGLLSKAGKVYRNIDIMLIAAVVACIILIGLLIAVNRKNLRNTKYWTGISAVISGIIGIVPCIYLSCTRYFDSFTIKQPQTFASFTGFMYKSTDKLIMNHGILIGTGILLIVLYAVFSGKMINLQSMSKRKQNPEKGDK